jgi:plastocyanin
MSRPRLALTIPGAAVATACMLLAAGCGSSSSGSGSTSSITASGAATPSTSTGTPTSSLKVTGTPKYGQASGPVHSGEVQVAYRNIAISPDTLRVKVGTTIKWTNYDSVEHNVTSEGGPQQFASKDFGEGGTYSIKALKPGVIHYQCTIHPASMNGTIEVVR